MGDVNPIPASGQTSFIAPYVLASDFPEMIYAGRDIIYRSVNGGGSWTATNGGAALDFNPAFAMAISPENFEIVYVATAPNFGRGHIFVTKDAGLSWTDITSTLPDRYCNDLEVDPNDEATVYASMGGYGSGHLYKSTDYGSSWTDISSALPDLPASAIAVDPANSSHLYLGNDLGIFHSEDGGVNWIAWTEGLPEAMIVMDLKVSPVDRKLRMGSHGNGMWERKLLAPPLPPPSGIGATQFDAEPLIIAPNPFGQQCKLSFDLSRSASYVMKVHDLNGRLLYSENYQLTAGKQLLYYYGKTSAGEELSPGTYLLSIEERSGAWAYKKEGTYFVSKVQKI